MLSHFLLLFLHLLYYWCCFQRVMFLLPGCCSGWWWWWWRWLCLKMCGVQMFNHCSVHQDMACSPSLWVRERDRHRQLLVIVCSPCRGWHFRLRSLTLGWVGDLLTLCFISAHICYLTDLTDFLNWTTVIVYCWYKKYSFFERSTVHQIHKVQSAFTQSFLFSKLAF